MTAESRREQIIKQMQISKFDTVGNLAKNLNVSTRTIKTDIQQLTCCGYPLQAEMGIGGGIRWLGGKKDFPFTDRQMLALRNAMTVVSAEDKFVLEQMLQVKDKPAVEIKNNDIFDLLRGDKSQTQLAAELGISGTLLSLVLSGKRKPSAELAERISKLRARGGD